MSGSTFGKLFKVTTFGESHGKGIGVVIDGCPAGVLLCEDDIQVDLDRRKPVSFEYATKRNESDTVEIVSGVFEGMTLGTPIALIIRNTDAQPQDYAALSDCFRPGHADFGYTQKYGFRDYRGGGRSSGRETAARVSAGAVARKVLTNLNITITAYTKSIGNITIADEAIDLSERFNNPLVMPNKKLAENATHILEECIQNGDSIGGIVECVIAGVRPGIGEPVFEKLDAELSKAIFSIGGVKGVEFGVGFQASEWLGSENNDSFFMDKNEICKHTNHSGGVLGGISDGSEIVFRAAFKPTPSIHKTQKTVNSKGNTEINILGRHDPVIAPRAVVVVEAMAALTILDYMLINMTARMDYIKKIYC